MPTATSTYFVANVRGIVGDGVTDDTDALLAAQAKITKRGGGVLRLPPKRVIGVRAGAAASDGCLKLTDHTWVDGQGATIRLLDGQDVNHDVTGVVRTPSGVVTTDVKIKNLKIDCNKAGNSTVVAGVARRVIGFYCGVTPQSTLTDTDISLEDVEIFNASAYGFDPHERTTRLRLRNCIAHDCGIDGFTIDGCYGANIAGCYAYANTRHGFNIVTGSADCTLEGCHSYGNGSNGLTIQNGSKRITVTGGIWRNNTGDGVLINGVPQVAPELDTTPGVSSKVVGAHINGNGGHGVHLVGVSECTIVANTVLDNSATAPGSAHGVYVDDSGTSYSTNNQIAINKVRGSHGYGVAEASANDTGNQILGNKISGATIAPLRLLGSADALASSSVSPGTPVVVYRNGPSDPWVLGDTAAVADFTAIRANGQPVFFQSPAAAAPAVGSGLSDEHPRDNWLEFKPAAFDPSTIPGLLYYWNPNSITAADGTAVASLPATNGGVALVQATGVRQPTIQTVGGQRVVRFPGSDGVSTDDKDLTGTVTATAQPVTVAFVHSIAGTVAQQLLDGGVQVLTSTTQLQAFAGSTLSRTLTLPDALGVTVVVFTGTTTRIYRNGGTPTVGNAGTTGMAATFRVGRHGTAGRPFNGDVGAITVHAGALTAAQVQSLGAGLASQYSTAAAWAAVTG
jgi:hypothetical protein